MSTGDNYLRDQIGGREALCPAPMSPLSGGFFLVKGKARTVQATVVAKEKIRN